MEKREDISTRYERLKVHLDEKSIRLWGAAEAMAIGRGGIVVVHEATGLAKRTISTGIRELNGEKPLAEGRIRRAGGGRPRTVDKDPALLQALESLVEPATMGDPESPLRWTTKSTRRLASELTAQGHPTSNRMVSELLAAQGYSLQGNRKTLEGSSHPDRNEQFEFIARRVEEFLAQGEPSISVDTKKKELVGNFKNAGRTWRPAGEPECVKVHDFLDVELGKVAPYGVYDIGNNEGWVNVGTDHDTSAFAVESIRRWWNLMGKERYPRATKLMITADNGGSNGSRVRLWKIELQKLANETGLEIMVSHLPPGTSKWNKIEHRLFSAISMNWRGRPLISHEVIIQLIQATTTRTGLKVHATIDDNLYPKGIKITEAQMSTLNLLRDEFHGDWNYTIRPE